jgi:hypothetical protein
MRRLWRDHSLLIVLLALFAGHTAGSLWFGWDVYVDETHDHGGNVTVHGFAQSWAYDYVTSLVADVYGFLIAVALTVKFRERFSPESK